MQLQEICKKRPISTGSGVVFSALPVEDAGKKAVYVLHRQRKTYEIFICPSRCMLLALP